MAQAVIERLGLSAKRPCRQKFESNLGKLPVALGIVMSQYRVNSSDGFSLLCVAAADHGCPLFDFAVMVVKKGRLAEGEMLEPCPAGSRSVLPQPGCSLGSFREAGWLDPRPRREPPLATPCR